MMVHNQVSASNMIPQENLKENNNYPTLPGGRDGERRLIITTHTFQGFKVGENGNRKRADKRE